MANQKVVGIFSTQEEAIRAIERLKSSGYNDDEISVLAKHHEDVDRLKDATHVDVDTHDAKDGAVGGALAGGALGGVVGALVDLGLSKEEAEDYRQYIERGDILVMVDEYPDRDVYGNFYENNSVIRDRYNYVPNNRL